MQETSQVSEKDVEIEQYNLLGQTIESQRRYHGPPHVSISGDTFRRIGRGFCGSVWTLHNTYPRPALKRADGAPTRYLWKEYYFQTRTIEAFQRLSSLAQDFVRVPYCYWYINASDTWWPSHISKFPSEIGVWIAIPQEACNAMYSELIPPLPKTMRETFINIFCPPRLQDEIKASKTNQDCLTRVFLGRRRTGRPSAFFSLRNFPLWLNQAEQLELPVESFARAMADALAIMHWEAKIDANYVEFVLGGPRVPERYPTTMLPSSTIKTLPYNSNTRGIELPRQTLEASVKQPSKQLFEMWMLDFDCCNTITMDEAGVEKAVAAFYRNDPYYPRPCDPSSQDFGLWTVFSERYLATGKAIMTRNAADSGLPAKFIDGLITFRNQNHNAPLDTVEAQQAAVEHVLFYNAFIADESS